MKLSRTCHISFCQIAPLKIRGGSASTHGAECSPRGVHRNNPLYPPYFKGDIEEGETPCVLEGMLKEIGESGVVYEVG
jgi:hypothetical protein